MPEPLTEPRRLPTSYQLVNHLASILSYNEILAGFQPAMNGVPTMKTKFVASAVAATMLVAVPLSSANADGWGRGGVGLGILGAAAVIGTAAAIASAPPPPVAYAAPPAVVYAAPPAGYYAPPPAVVYAAPPAYYYAAPPVVYYAAPGYYYRRY